MSTTFPTTGMAQPSAPSGQADALARLTARIDRLPPARHLWWLVVLISLGGYFEIYDLIFMGYVAPAMAHSGILATTTASFFAFKGFGAFVAATFAGLFVGTFGLSFLADRYGRRAVFTYSLLWYSVCSAVLAFQQDAAGLLIWRFAAGVGIGVEIITIDTYISELVPRTMRGRAIAVNQAIMFLSAPAAALVSYFLVPTTLFGLAGWRWVILLGAGGAAVVWFIRRPVPESPRWLGRNGRLEQAERIVAGIEQRIERSQGYALAEPRLAQVSASASKSTLAALWRAPYRSRLIMLVVFNLFQAIGYYGFANWVPTLLVHQGVSVTKSLLYSSLIALALPLGPLLAATFADRMERKSIIVGSALGVIVFGLAFATLRTPALLVICGLMVSLFGQFISVGYHAYQSELFPTPVRARAGGLVYSASRIGAMFSGFLIAFLLRNFGVTGVFIGIVACMGMIVISIGVFGPRTTGLSLDQISH